MLRTLGGVGGLVIQQSFNGQDACAPLGGTNLSKTFSSRD